MQLSHGAGLRLTSLMGTEKFNRFMSWKDLIITPAVETVILAVSLTSVFSLNHLVALSLFANAMLFYAAMVIWTLIALKVIRVLFPIKEGVFSYSDNPLACYIWNLHAFLCITNLSLHYINGLLPPPLRKLFYAALGANMGKGIISIGGRLVDPHLVTIEESAMIGDDTLLTPHAYARTTTDILILGKIEIKKNAIVGAKSMILPGVTVGENSMVTAMSLVAMNTKIPANQIWGGNPAIKIADMSGR
jgi:hypothetical protein